MEDNARKLYDSQDPLLFFRLFVAKNETLKPGKRVVLLWTKFDTIPALMNIATTVDGLKGYVSNGHSLGVRIDAKCVRQARQALQRPNPRITTTNANVFGSMSYEIEGFPIGTSAHAVTTMLHNSNTDAGWTSWNVIPTNHIQRGALSSWIVKADTEPALRRVILGDGKFKVVIRKLPSRNEQIEKTKTTEQEHSERAKAERRATILAETSQTQFDDDPWQKADPWEKWNGARKGKGNGKRPP